MVTLTYESARWPSRKDCIAVACGLRCWLGYRRRSQSGCWRWLGDGCGRWRRLLDGRRERSEPGGCLHRSRSRPRAGFREHRQQGPADHAHHYQATEYQKNQGRLPAPHCTPHLASPLTLRFWTDLQTLQSWPRTGVDLQGLLQPRSRILAIINIGIGKAQLVIVLNRCRT